jgi:hypothetical protein
LEKATFAVNISFNRAIGTTPYNLKYGTIPLLEIDKKFNIQISHKSLQEMRNQRKISFESYQKSIEKGKRTVYMNLKIGDPVLIFREPLKDKFAQNWWPGYKIKQIILPSAYLVTNGSSEYRLNKAHVKFDESERGKGGVVILPIKK